jgi:hypothetical protein
MKERPIFVRRKDTLSIDDASYYQDLLYRTVKIGTELEFALPKGTRREDIQPQIESLLLPSKDMNRLGRLGIYDVIKEHCGVEVQVIGRHPHWEMLLRQYQQILPPLLGKGVRMRPTCGLHFHLIGIGLAESIPEIVLANFWNLTRKYAPGLKFLTSGGDNRLALCRRRQHNAHQEFMRQSPIHQSMQDIKTNLHKSLEVPEHQNFVNLEHLGFDEAGDVYPFHLEMRFPDGDLAPVSITAKTFLFLAMLLKAVEISKFGLLHVDKVRNWKRKKRLMDLISNNDGLQATSDTSAITRELIQEFRDVARDLLRFLKSIFIILDNPAEMVLEALAEKPVSFRRITGDSWSKIDQDLFQLIQPERMMDEVDHRIIKIIELGLVENVSSHEEWYAEAARTCGLSKETVRQRLQGYRKREPKWDPKLGRMVFLK